jgi:hypothetical protein
MENQQVSHLDTKSTLPATLSNADMGVEEMISGDIKIPRALLLQKMSKLVDLEKGKAGEIRGSLEANLLGGVDKEFLFIPLYMYNSWAIHEEVGGKFRRMEPRTAANDKQEWEFKDSDGVSCKRVKCINAFIMAVKDLDDGEPLPYQLTFRSTSFDAGRTMSSIIAKLLQFGKPIYNYVFSLGSIKQENDKGTFYVMDLKRAENEGRKITTNPEYIATCKYWMDQVRGGRVIVDSEVEEASELPSADVPF